MSAAEEPIWLNESIIAVLLFIATQIVGYYLHWRSVLRRRSDLMIGLIIEIDFNQRQLDAFVTQIPSEEFFLARMRDLGLKRPHWNYAHHSHFYEANVSQLVLDPLLMKRVITLYNLLGSIRDDVLSLQFDSYLEITDDGRAWFLRSIWADMRRAVRACRETLYLIEIQYTADWQSAIRSREDAGRSSADSTNISMTNVRQG